jgi:hypothetical protein
MASTDTPHGVPAKGGNICFKRNKFSAVGHRKEKPKFVKERDYVNPYRTARQVLFRHHNRVSNYVYKKVKPYIIGMNTRIQISFKENNGILFPLLARTGRDVRFSGIAAWPAYSGERKQNKEPNRHRATGQRAITGFDQRLRLSCISVL